MSSFSLTPLNLLLILINFCSGSEVSDLPTCNYATSGGTVVLPCYVTDHTSSTVSWRKSGLAYIQISNTGVTIRPVDSISGLNGSRYTVDVDFSTDYWFNMTIATVVNNDTGDYTCGPGINDEAGELLLAVDANSIYVEFNGTEHESSKSNIGAFEQKSYTLNVTAENSLPETTFEWNIIDGSKPAEIVNSAYNYTNNGSCEPFTSTGSATYDLTMIESDYFTIRLTATNEITGQSTTIDLNGTILAVTESGTGTSSIFSTGAIIGIVLAVVILCILGVIGCVCYMKRSRRPIDVHVIKSTETELIISWTGHNGGCSHTFTVEYRIFGSGKAWMKATDVDKPPVTLTGLQPLTEYEIRVIIKDMLLDSSSEPITARTTAKAG